MPEATPRPWQFANHDDVLAKPGEVLGLVDADGKPILEIGTGGFACESDPYGSYPLLEASPEVWALIKAAPVMRAALNLLVFNESKADQVGGMVDNPHLKALRASARRAREVLAEIDAAIAQAQEPAR